MTTTTPVSMRRSTGSAEQVVDDRLHAELGHAEGVLQHERVHLAGSHGSDEGRGVVEADELDLPGDPAVLEREQRPRARRLVDDEQPVHLAAEAVEQVLGRALGRVARRAGVLVGGDHLQARASAPSGGPRKPSSRAVVLAEPSWNRSSTTWPLPSEQASHLVGAPARRPSGCRSPRSSRSGRRRGPSRSPRSGCRAASPPPPAAPAPSRRAARARSRRRPGSRRTRRPAPAARGRPRAAVPSRSSSSFTPEASTSRCALDGAGVDGAPELHVRRLRHDGDPQRPVLPGVPPPLRQPALAIAPSAAAANSRPASAEGRRELGGTGRPPVVVRIICGAQRVSTALGLGGGFVPTAAARQPCIISVGVVRRPVTTQSPQSSEDRMRWEDRAESDNVEDRRGMRHPGRRRRDRVRRPPDRARDLARDGCRPAQDPRHHRGRAAGRPAGDGAARARTARAESRTRRRSSCA